MSSTNAFARRWFLTASAGAGGVTPDIPSVTGANGAITNPGFLKYPANLVKTVTGKVRSGGTYNAVAPSWRPIPPAGNASRTCA